MSTRTDQTPARRKAEARAALEIYIHAWSSATPDGWQRLRGSRMDALIDAYARARVAEAVAPAVAEIDRLIKTQWGNQWSQLRELRKLLTERAGT